MTIAQEMLQLATRAREASRLVATLPSGIKNDLLRRMAEALLENAAPLKTANALDLAAGRAKAMAPAMLDRLELSDQVLQSMADGLREVAALPDPVGEITGMWLRPNGIRVGRQR
ncbi:MAG: gamma-glutamyl-phosphate reductase, partial [Deltaproteobacteria bacterium]|nr:gamma-glutamyl-phosphate reductase [Deltaproteobacteria bacterium]